MFQKHIEAQESFLKESSTSFKPIFFRLNSVKDRISLQNLLKQYTQIIIYDTIHGQLKELLKSRNPNTTYSESQLDDLAKDYLSGTNPDEYGIWVYYPWSFRLVHILDKDEFIEIRTSRNQHKITREEQKLLMKKKVGVIGLSVGQSVSLTLALERSFEEIRIADFDTLELSNLNRIRTGIHNLGVKKTIAVAREIAEIDPFLNVTCFHEGITNSNLSNFINDGGQLDAIIEECDNIEVKINTRLAAKKYKIPVIMDSSDRGMIDIERFDLNDKIPIFHGYLTNFNFSDKNYDYQSNKMEMVYAIIDKNKISARLKSSIEEIGKTITTWPQLASSVIAGGANAANVFRKIMLKEPIKSGRYYIDMDEIVESLEK